MRKAIGLLIIALAIGGSLSLSGHKVYRVEVVIAAPPQAVWAVLTDSTGYKDWNPVFVAIDGTYGAGEKITTTVLFPDETLMPLEGTVAEFEPNRLLRQTGGVLGFLTFDHRWELEAVEGGTKVTQYEENRGLYVWFWDSSWVRPAYQAALERLKAHVEVG